MQRRLKVLVVAASFLFATTAHSQTTFLPDTGQTKCYSSTKEIPCSGTGQDGAYVQNPLSYTDNRDGTVTDDNTGLVWQQNQISQPDFEYTNWYWATGTYDVNNNPATMNICGSLTLGGYANWRLPARSELIGLVDYSVPGPRPMINDAFFPNTTSSYFWTSETYADMPIAGWYVFFGIGYSGGASKEVNLHARCVRGAQPPGQNLVDNGNGTVSDNQTGLTWQKGELKPMSWVSAAGSRAGKPCSRGGCASCSRWPRAKRRCASSTSARWPNNGPDAPARRPTRSCRASSAARQRPWGPISTGRAA